MMIVCNMMPRMPSTLFILIGFCTLTTTTGYFTVQNRYSEDQFNEVSKPFFSLQRTYENKVEKPGLFRYGDEFEKPDGVKVTIPRDGILKTEASFDTVTVTATLSLHMLETLFFDVSTDVNFRSCTLTSEGNVDSVLTLTSGHSVSFDVNGGCHFECLDYDAPLIFNHTLSQHLNKEDLMKRLEETVCQTYKVNYGIVFNDRPSNLTASLSNVSTEIVDAHVQIVDSALVFTIRMAYESALPQVPRPQLGPPREIPRSYKQKDPFEIWKHASMFDDFLSDVRQMLFTGNRTANLSGLLPLLSEHKIQQLGDLIISLGETFPDSTYAAVVRDMVCKTSISNGSFWIHMNITGEITATLNCNPNRTYTAFSFRALMSGPAQFAFDHRTFGFKVTSFRGNFTVLQSNIGIVGDRFIKSIFYVLPQIISDGDIYTAHRKHIVGRRLSDVLPIGYNIENVTIRLLEDYMVIGGRLTTRNVEANRIPKDNLTWIGAIGNTKYFSFPFLENTLENATKLPIQNCKEPNVNSASGLLFMSNNIAVMFALTVMMYFMSHDMNG